MLSFIYVRIKFDDTTSTYLNTSHVIFYLRQANAKKKGEKDLNTSHVIFYHNREYVYMVPTPFKYISCYLLSSTPLDIALCIAVFKYISCYLLSDYPIRTYGRQPGFKYISCYLLSFYRIRIIKNPNI